VLFERTDSREVRHPSLPSSDLVEMGFTTSWVYIYSSTRLLMFSPMDFTWQQRARRELERADSVGPRHPEYRYSTEFQSHEPEVSFTSLFMWVEGVCEQ
jgi:hypothetical protein